MEAICVEIQGDFIRLDSFLKFGGAAETGGRVKILIQEGHVRVNGKACTRRGTKIRPGDCVAFGGNRYVCDKATV